MSKYHGDGNKLPIILSTLNTLSIYIYVIQYAATSLYKAASRLRYRHYYTGLEMFS